MNIKLSQHTPRITKGSTLITRNKNISTRIRGITLQDLGEIYLILDVILVMRRDIFLDIVPRTKRRIKTRKYIMLTLQRMMNLPRREPEEIVNILQVMKNML